MKFHTSVLLIALLCTSLNAQKRTFNITGEVKDFHSQEKIPLCNVFLSGSTIGTSTDTDGVFALTNIAPGTYDIIISHVNYAFHYTQVKVTDSDINLGTIFLKEDVKAMDAVEVKGKTDRKWQRQFKRFQKFILGDYYSAKNIEIINPYAAEFIEADGSLQPKFPFTLELVNLYTGYQIQFAIENFEVGKRGHEYVIGYSHFNEMKAENDQETEQWKANRLKAHNGSINHFFYALINQKLNENGFDAKITNHIPGSDKALAAETIRYSEKVTGEDLAGIFETTQTTNPDITRIRFSGLLQINYLKEYGANKLGQESYIELLGDYIEVYANGVPVDPLSFKVHGYLATEGLYEMLPSDLELNPLNMVATKVDAGALIAQNLQTNVTEFAQEKAYLHIAKPYFSANESIWYKAYVVAGPTHLPSSISQNLQVELYNSKNELLYEQTIALNQGVGNGDIQLSDTLETGDYRLRAYTPWMVNFDKGFVFERNIKIHGTEKEATDDWSAPVKINFYPEGGDLITGINSTVAFETSRVNHEVNGFVFNNKGDTILNFKTSHDNLGQFSFTPQKNTTYYALIDGLSTRFELPKAKDTGLGLKLRESATLDSLKIEVTEANDNQVQNAQLLIHTRGITYYNKPLLWEGKSAIVTISKQLFPSGISHITLFNQDWKPEAERLFFHQSKADLADTKITTNKQSYSQRDSTAITINVQDALGNPLSANLSVAVYDTEQIFPNLFQDNITSYLLLSADVEQGVNASAGYLQNLHKKDRQALNLILMTKGWRRFKWKDILANKTPNIIQAPMHGFSVNGVLSSSNGAPLSGIKVMHIDQFAGLPTFNEVVSDAEGKFTMEGLKYGLGESFIQLDNFPISGDVKLQLEEAHKPDLNSWQSFSQPIPKSITRNFIIKRQRVIAIDSAFYRDLGTFVVERTKSEMLEDKTRGLVYNAGDYSYDVEALTRSGSYFHTPLHALLGRTPGFKMVTSKYGDLDPVVRLDRQDNGIIFNKDTLPTFLIDDALVSLSEVMNLAPDRVKRIEVFKSNRAFLYYGPTIGGVIAIYTKTSNEMIESKQFNSQKGQTKALLQAILPGGYYSPREFYSPNYSLEEPEHIKPDLRNLVHWDPNITTDELGNAQLSFYNTDLETTIQVHVEGISSNGVPIYKTIQYQVTSNTQGDDLQQQ